MTDEEKREQIILNIAEEMRRVKGFIVASVVSDGKLLKYVFLKFRDLMKRKMEEEK